MTTSQKQFKNLLAWEAFLPTLVQIPTFNL